MILAAYLVTGFLVASIYAVGMLRGRRDRIHRLGLLIPLTVACIATPIQFAVGDSAARAIAAHQPIKFAGMECVETDVHRRHGVHLRPLHVERSQGRARHPRLRLVPRRLEHEHQGDRARLRACRRSPPGEHDAALGLRHDGRDLHHADRASRSGSGSPGGASGTSRRRAGSCGRPPLSGVAAVVALECGWIVTEVGRQPWIVYNVMRTSDAVTQAERSLGHLRGSCSASTSRWARR